MHSPKAVYDWDKCWCYYLYRQNLLCKWCVRRLHGSVPTLTALLQFSWTMFIILWASHSCRRHGDQQLRRGSNEMGLGLFFPWFTRLRDFESSVVLFCLFSLMTLISRVLWWDCAIAACKLRVCVRHQQRGCRRLARVSQDWRWARHPLSACLAVGVPCRLSIHPRACV